MAKLTEEQLRRRIAELARRMPQNRQRYASTGRRNLQNLNISDLTARDINPSLGLRRPEAAEVAPEVEADVPARETPSNIQSPDTEGPADLESPNLNPIQARMRDDYATPELASLGKKTAGKGIGSVALGSYYGAPLGAVIGGSVKSMLNPTYSAGYGLYKAIDAYSDANYKGKQLENIFSEQGFGLGDTYAQDQITQAQDYDKYSKDPDVMGSYTAPPSEFLDPDVLAAIGEDPTWLQKLGLTKQGEGDGGERLGYGRQSPTADVTPEGSNLGNIAMDDQIGAMLAIGKGQDVPADGGGLYKDDEDGGTDYNSIQDDWSGISDDIGDGSGDDGK